jgi:hypothetical protein
VNAYCQVMQFGTDAQAQAFVAALQPVRSDLETAGLTFLPSGELEIAELRREDDSRVFTIQAAGDWNLAAVLHTDGPFIVSVYTGGRGVVPDPETATAVLASVEARVSAD